jgi:hypothetical protein
MKPHQILACIFLPAIVAGLAIWLAAEHQARLDRVAEHQALEQECRQMTDLAAQNEQLSKLLAQASLPKPLPPDEMMELLRLRGQVGVLRRQQSDLDQARKENQLIHAVLAKYLERMTETNVAATADYWPQDSWTNTGYGSPEAALQTALWAGTSGDLTNFYASVTEDVQTNMANEYKGKSDMEASVRLADEVAGVQSVQILSREVLDDNSVLLTVELEAQDKFQTVKVLMQRIGGEWKSGGPQP